VQHRELTVEREVLVAQLAVGHADAEAVVAHDGGDLGDRAPERAERRVLPVELEVAHPPRRRDERRARAGHRVGDPAVPHLEEADRSLITHERSPP
jgi:hypothetical protein